MEVTPLEEGTSNEKEDQVRYLLQNIKSSIDSFLDLYKANNKRKYEIRKLINSKFKNAGLLKLKKVLKYGRRKKKNEVIREQKNNSLLYIQRNHEISQVKQYLTQVSQEDCQPNKLVKQNEDKQKKKQYWMSCYICKQRFNQENPIHHFYHNLCINCGDFNYSFRVIHLNLTGRIAVVTGGRIKIGYYIVLQLLKYNCKVIVTTRFPQDALSRFKQEKDFNIFKSNLVIYPLDLRFVKSIAKFLKYLTDNFSYLDILINNAAQTIRRPSSYYKYLLQIESSQLNEEDAKIIVKCDTPELSPGGIISENQLNLNINSNLPMSVMTSQLKLVDENTTTDLKENEKYFGPDGQPIDFSSNKNSWNLELDEITFPEFVEVQIINSWAPFILCSQIKSLLSKSPFPDRYIVNVTAVEGIFNHFKKTTHPHTNMAKAGLNMLTRTSSEYYKNSGIYMTCVDTGWVSAMNEFNKLYKSSTDSEAFEDEYINVPLDELDGAMRVLHPVIEGIKNKNFIYGVLLKDYKVAQW